MKRLFKIFFLLFVTLVSIPSFGQKKYIDFVKTINYDRQYSLSETGESHLASIELTKDSGSLSVSKVIYFDPINEKKSYLISVVTEVNDLYAYWSNSEDLSIYHKWYDTINQLSYQIIFEMDSGVVWNSEVAMEEHQENKIHYFALDNQLTQYYKNWMITDLNAINSLSSPQPYTISLLEQEKTRWRKYDSAERGDTIIKTQYYIDSIFSGAYPKRDSICTLQTKNVERKSKEITEKYTERIQASERIIEFIEYDTILQRTIQRLTTLQGIDTVFDIKIQTYLENGKFISDYEITGNHPIESFLQRHGPYRPTPYFKLDSLQSRKIHIVRDSTGYIVSGNAEGTSSSGEILKCTLATTVYSSKYLWIKRQHGIALREVQNPQKIYVKVNGQLEGRQFDLVSLYPNIDIEPLGKINLIGANGVMFDFKEVPHRDFQRRRKYKAYKLPSRTPRRIRKNARRIKSKDENIVKWKEKDMFSHTIYEVHFKETR